MGRVDTGRLLLVLIRRASAPRSQRVRSPLSRFGCGSGRPLSAAISIGRAVGSLSAAVAPFDFGGVYRSFRACGSNDWFGPRFIASRRPGLPGTGPQIDVRFVRFLYIQAART